MTLTAVNIGDAANATTVNQFYTALKGTATDAYTLKHTSNSAYALTVVNTGSGGALRVRNAADSANVLTIGDTTSTLGSDLQALSLTMTGGILTSPRTHSPRLKIVESGSAASPVYTYDDWNPHTLYVMDADANPNKTAIYIESVSTDNTAASGSEVAGSGGKRKRVNTGIAIFHYSQKDNGGDVSGIAVTEWGNGNAGTFVRSQSTGSGARPVSIAAPADAYSRTYGFAIETYADGYGTTIDTQARGSGAAMIMGVGPYSTTTGDNSGTREYADGIRIYPYLAGITAAGGTISSDSGTATAGASLTLTDSGKAWSTDAWLYYIVRITGGTGSGQERYIASNTATVLTVDSAWTTNPDATSTYTIDTFQDERSAIRVTSAVSALSYYLNKYDTFSVMLDGKTRIITNRVSSATPGAAGAYLRLLGRDATAGRYAPEVQFGYQAADTGTTGSPATERVYAAIGGFLMDGGNNGGGGIGFATRRVSTDASLTNVVTINQAGHVDFSYGIATKYAAATLANGLNSNIATAASTQSFLRVTGPTGAFSVGGFQNPRDGQHLWVFNSTSQNMTIVNEDASSTAANRILTLTGADVVQSGVSCVHLIYSTVDSRWILVSAQA